MSYSVFSDNGLECHCGMEFLPYGFEMGPFNRLPPIFGHGPQPLVYFAQVQQQPSNNVPKCKESCKPNNCFAKACKWYNEERKPSQMDATGFAMWLDAKYEQYLSDGPTGLNLRRSVTHTEHISVKNNCDSNAAGAGGVPHEKKFSRLRSPWRKRNKSLVGTKESSDCKKHSASCEFILKPKSLTRRASEENYQVSRTNHSKTTTSSYIAAENLNKDLKYGSTTSIIQKRPETVIQPPKVEELPKKNEKSKPKKECLKKNKNKNKMDKSKCLDSSCSCPHNDPPELADNTCQTSLVCCTCQNDFLQAQSTRKFIVVSDVQTSDYSIKLDNNVCPDQILLMRVECAHTRTTTACACAGLCEKC